MKIDTDNYEQLKAWFAHLFPLTHSAVDIPLEANPLTVLGQIESKWPSRARSGLAMAIGDTIEMTDDWPVEKVLETDLLLARDGLPTLTEIRIRFSKTIRRVLKRGSINNDVEYYALRNAVEFAHDGSAEMWALISDYEAQREH